MAYPGYGQYPPPQQAYGNPPPQPAYGNPYSQTTITNQPYTNDPYYQQQLPVDPDAPKTKSKAVAHNGVGNRKPKDFRHELFDCSSGGVPFCVLAGFFMPCCLCPLARDMDECLCLPLLLGGVGTLLTLRVKARTKYNIKGKIWEDCLVSTFCGPCTLCQLRGEIDHWNPK